MKVTTRNILEGVVTSVKRGVVNDEVDIDLKGGLKVAAVVTCQSTETLKLEPGREVLAMVKGVNVLLVRESDGFFAQHAARQGRERKKRADHGQRGRGAGKRRASDLRMHGGQRG